MSVGKEGLSCPSVAGKCGRDVRGSYRSRKVTQLVTVCLLPLPPYQPGPTFSILLSSGNTVAYAQRCVYSNDQTATTKDNVHSIDVCLACSKPGFTPSKPAVVAHAESPEAEAEGPWDQNHPP